MNIAFRNQTSEALTLYWIDFEGQRKSYGEVDPGREKRQSTFERHLWQLESDSGQILGQFSATDEDSIAEVKQNNLSKLENRLVDDWSKLRSDRNANEVTSRFAIRLPKHSHSTGSISKDSGSPTAKLTQDEPRNSIHLKGIDGSWSRNPGNSWGGLSPLLRTQ